ncbi:hypothetical protein, partial [Geobacillus thermoleovorans]|uniref:hypothetical protein n=1 Tax=Geobacillus thermoleovorans TaxID=33941 RepID=UPI003DA4FFB7
MNFDPHVHHLFFQTSFSVLNGCFLRQAEECTFAADFMEMTLARPTRLKKGLTQNANAFWDQPPLFCLKYRRIALFSGRIESPKPLPPKE